MTALAVVSGGLDSVTLAHHLHARGELGAVVSFDYGQRHVRELPHAVACADRLGVSHSLVPMQFLGDMLGSALTSGDRPVPDGHYAEATMRVTVVPNRNMIMLAVAAGLAALHGHQQVATGVHGGDHFIYPDCRPAFIAAVNAATLAATDDGHGSVAVVAPFITHDKAYIAGLAGDLLGPDLIASGTWSCYKGGEVHCGRCGTCVERAEALALAGVPDRTVYADPDYWRTVT